MSERDDSGTTGRTDDLPRGLVERSSAGVALFDEQLRVLEKNSELLRQLNRRFGEVRGRRFPEQTVKGRPEQAEPGRRLSDLETRILEGIAAGISVVELGSQLYLSRQGVEYHVRHMLRALEAANRPALISRAYSLGMFTTGVWPPKVRAEFVK
ncbi:helix-turn-helix transcriptional regulator [Amycolatopsis coloradensis]|uniref:helix-turn-helix transcriptional regulator n=1 Tax=Amycolatopsis coloradensis TaxID=76021 RepID=UPI001FC97F97|nr:LuxR C-terminal-related transcriptional regulator [Amycolatopsis coloradensis]